MTTLDGTTTMERLALVILNGGDEFEGTPSMCFDTLVDLTGIKAESLRGVVSSLSKKGLISFGEYPNGTESIHNLVKFNF